MKLIFNGRRFLLLIPAGLLVFFTGFFFHLNTGSGVNSLQSTPTQAAINASTQAHSLFARAANLPRSGLEATSTILSADRTTVIPGLSFKGDPTETATMSPGDHWIVTPNQPQSSDSQITTPIDQGKPSLSLDEFTAQMANGEAGDLRGLYASGLMALVIVPQPSGDSAFIDLGEQTATRFQLADPYGMVGLLAHNFLAGRYFLKVELGQELTLVYGDKQQQTYQVSEIDDFQRLTPEDLSSNFLELSSNVEQTANQVFARFYERAGYLTLQTCIERDGHSDWGVRFVVAEPVLSK